jgi:lipopolysaccharide/colanic/teichoic acid biosynthesis glycosyltransferase
MATAHDMSHLQRLIATAVVDLETIHNCAQSPISKRGSTLKINTWRHAPLKRLFDFVFSSLLIFLLAPLMVLIALLVIAESGRPLVFRQIRVGHYRCAFTIFKFRTMLPTDAGAKVVQASRNDDRVTRVGRILRMTSLDELPQLFNVLRGEMSLVGPRPHAVEHDQYFLQMFSDYSLRYQVKPGITGLAQITGSRGVTDTPEKVAARIGADTWYIENWSILLDVKILFATALTMWLDDAAY